MLLFKLFDDCICADPLIVLGPPEPLACAEEEPMRNKCGEIDVTKLKKDKNLGLSSQK